MLGSNQYATETARLCDQTIECRLKAVQSQLSASFTLCAFAEMEVRHGSPYQALELVKKLRHHAETIHTHIDEPDHLPKIAIRNLRGQLTQLETRTQEIESCLSSAVIGRNGVAKTRTL